MELPATAQNCSWRAEKEMKWKALSTEKKLEELSAYLDQIWKKANDAIGAAEKIKYLALYDDIAKTDTTYILPITVLIELTSLGLEAYQNGDFASAETAFRILSERNDSNGRNNYAYMIRRGEVIDPHVHPPIEALHLLRIGLLERETFAFVNMALVFALCYGRDEDWKIADELISHMPGYNVASVQSWWADVGRRGEIEGFLVHYLLLRHKKIHSSEFGSEARLSEKLTNDLAGFPEWLQIAMG